jgi:hypothetical protein
MTESELLQRMRADMPPASDLVRAKARRRVMDATRGPRLVPIRRYREPVNWRRFLASAVIVTAATAVVVAVGVTALPGSSPTSAANAAVRALREAASNTRVSTASIGQPGQYVHVHTESQGVSFAGHIAYLSPGTTDMWLPSTGKGLGYVRSVTEEPVFQQAGDAVQLRRSGMWPADVNVESVGSFDSARRLQDNLATPSYAYLATLPTDATALYSRLAAYVRSCHCGQSFSQQMLDTVATMLANGTPTPALRKALFQVASRIPGIRLTAARTTLNGETGTAIAVDSDGTRTELIFDPRTGAYLGQRETWVRPDPSHEIGPNGLTGQSVTTLTIVDRVPRTIRQSATYHPYSRGA